MDDTTPIEAFQSQLISGVLRKETLHDADGTLDTYWIEFRNGRGETFWLQVNQAPDLATVLEKAVRHVQDNDAQALDFELGTVFPDPATIY